MDANVVFVTLTPEQVAEMVLAYPAMVDDANDVEAMLTKLPVLGKRLFLVFDLGETTLAQLTTQYRINLGTEAIPDSPIKARLTSPFKVETEGIETFKKVFHA